MSEKNWFGLTGGIATGKSTVGRLLSEANSAVIDADVLARKAVEPGAYAYNQLVQDFGEGILNLDKGLNREKLAAELFGSAESRKKIEAIIHPEVRRLSFKEYREFEGKKYFPIFYDVPLLYEKSMEKLFKAVVVVACDPEIQLERLMSRNNLSENDAKKRISSQLALKKKIERADFVIWNNGSLKDLSSEVDTLLSYLLAD